jgi:hypothetical protein
MMAVSCLGAVAAARTAVRAEPGDFRVMSFNVRYANTIDADRCAHA